MGKRAIQKKYKKIFNEFIERSHRQPKINLTYFLLINPGYFFEFGVNTNVGIKARIIQVYIGRFFCFFVLTNAS